MKIEKNGGTHVCHQMDRPMGEKTKVCKQCHKRLPATTLFFRAKKTIHGIPELRGSCKMCESNRRHSEDRWKRKAQRTIGYHRQRALEEYKIAPDRFPSWDGKPHTFARTYGWDTNKIAREMEAVYEGPCRKCGLPYKPMGHGRDDLTVDIIDPTSEPFYDDNTRLVCGSCNSHKGSKTPEEERQVSRAYQRWLETGRDFHQLSFLLIPGSPGALPPAQEGKAVPAEEKPAIYEADEQLKLFAVGL